MIYKLFRIIAFDICYNVRLLDRLSLLEIHREANLASLEQRRHIQLLCLMYIYKKNCKCGACI